MNNHVDQVGGDHYQADFQHWDMVAFSKMGYLEGNATKYISRWRKKNGQQDLDKAISYIEKMKALSNQYENTSMFAFHTRRAMGYMQRWFDNVELTQGEADLCCLIACWDTVADLDRAVLWTRMLPAEGSQTASGTPTPRKGQTAAPAAPCGGAGRTMGQAAGTSTSTGVHTGGQTNHPAPFGYEGDG